MTLRVELIFAQPSHTASLELELPQGATVREALYCARKAGAPWCELPALADGLRGSQDESGVEASLPAGEGPTSTFSVAIWNQPVSADRVLQNGDRIEWLRPLLADAKQERRERVEQSRAAAYRSRWRPNARGPLTPPPPSV